MKFNRNWWTIYMNEASGGEDGAGGGGEDSDKSLLGGKDEPLELADGEYWLAEGVKGTGEIPKWYDSARFKSVDQQAKSYLELEKKFGGFTGAPKDGYELPENIDKDDETLKLYSDYAKKFNMNQDAFNEGFQFIEQVFQAKADIDEQEEREKLGPQSENRINRVQNYLANKLDDEGYKEIRKMLTSANSIMLVEKLIDLTAPPKLPSEGGDNPQGLTPALIREAAAAKTEDGQLRRAVDPDYRAKVSQMYKDYYGEEPHSLEVG